MLNEGVHLHFDTHSLIYRISRAEGYERQCECKEEVGAN